MRGRDEIIRELIDNKVTVVTNEGERIWNLAIQRAIDIILKPNYEKSELDSRPISTATPKEKQDA